MVFFKMLCILLYLFCVYFVLILHCTIQVFKCQRAGGRRRWDQRGTNTFEATQEVTLPTIHSQFATLWEIKFKVKIAQAMCNDKCFQVFVEIYSKHKR